MCYAVKWKVRWPAAGMMNVMGALPRPAGVSSRIIRAKGPRHPWTAQGETVDLPVIIDWVWVDPATGEELVRIEAKVDLVGDAPAIVQMSFVASAGLDTLTLQRDFRWTTPLDIVTGLLPQLLHAGVDVYKSDLPVTGFPAHRDSARPAAPIPQR